MKTEESYSTLVSNEYDVFLEAFEKTFNHKAFTGRSGTFFGYEGLGSIYWHMVSKLQLAVQEVIISAEQATTDERTLERLIVHYNEIKSGIGMTKSPDHYGAFPTDPYSHTPMGKGAQQPGMTGQVKEDIISRWGELGVSVIDGCLSFHPQILNEAEFLTEKASFQFYDHNANLQTLGLEAGSLAFTYCQIPIVYSKGKKASITVNFEDGSKLTIEKSTLDRQMSEMIFQKSGRVKSLKVEISTSILQ
jgi:hypothetical protein